MVGVVCILLEELWRREGGFWGECVLGLVRGVLGDRGWWGVARGGGGRFVREDEDGGSQVQR